MFQTDFKGGSTSVAHVSAAVDNEVSEPCLLQDISY